MTLQRPELVWPGKYDERGRRREVVPAHHRTPLRLAERWTGDGDGRVFSGDNLAVMASLLGDGERFGVIVMDPPFNARQRFDAARTVAGHTVSVPAYDDRWGRDEHSWHHQLWMRLVLARELLADDGSLFLHIDQRVAADARFLLDDVFGHDQFRNEIVWSYKSGGATKRRFGRKHDTIYFYSKTDDYFFEPQKEKSYNRDLKPYRFAGVEEYKDDVGWHTLVNKRDVWEIDMVGRTSRERVDYPTQKPIALLRTILASTRGPAADFYAGSGVLGAAAHALGRPWTLCDSSPLARAVMRRRFADANAAFDLLKTDSPGKSTPHPDLEVQRTSHGSTSATLHGTLTDEAQALLLLDPATRDVKASAFREADSLTWTGSLSAPGALDAVVVLPDGREIRDPA